MRQIVSVIEISPQLRTKRTSAVREKAGSRNCQAAERIIECASDVHFWRFPLTQTGTGVVAVLFLIMITAHCGGSSRHDLVSITVTPPSATAVSPNGTVQFVAIGNFSSAPATQKIAVSWTAEPPFSAIDSNGLATCLMPSNPPGTPLGIRASSSGNAKGDPLFGTIEGTASLTCQ
jgi:hypothetical protein